MSARLSRRQPWTRSESKSLPLAAELCKNAAPSGKLLAPPALQALGCHATPSLGLRQADSSQNGYGLCLSLRSGLCS
jgi:hypothetical protein